MAQSEPSPHLALIFFWGGSGGEVPKPPRASEWKVTPLPFLCSFLSHVPESCGNHLHNSCMRSKRLAVKAQGVSFLFINHLPPAILSHDGRRRLSRSETTSWDVAPLFPCLSPCDTCITNLRKEPMLRLFTHVISCVQSDHM